MEKDFNAQSSAVPLDGHQSEKKNPLTGLVEWIPSLAPVWCTDVQFLCYVPPQVTSSDEITPEWIQALEIMNNDLQWLLLQSHQKFWCQVMYDQTLQKFLDSYVQSAPRRDEYPKLPAGVEETAKELNRRVFVTFFRMSTPKETAVHYLTDEAYSSIIYDHYLFDVPKLMDLCVMYGRANQAALRTMLTTIFERQPKYTEDLVNAAKGLVQVLNKAAERCHEIEGGITDANDLADLILYLADISSTLRAFLEVYPSGGPHLEQVGLIERLVHFYESTIPSVQTAWHIHKRSISSRAGYLKKRFRQAKCDFSWVVNSLLHLCYLSKVDTTSDALHDGFLHAISTILSEKEFLHQFQKLFSLKDCVQQMQHNHPDLDSTHFTFVLTALGEDVVAAKDTNESVTPPSAALEGLIKHVKDVLPELGEAFIMACLSEYQNDAEAVINHILEGTLPPHMHQLDGSTPPPKTEGGTQQTTREPSLVSQRANVYDGDDFDVFRRSDIDLSKVSIGKRYDPLSAATLLSDKSHLKHIRDLYKNFEYESNDPFECLNEETVRENYQKSYLFDSYTYDDEYDDTYDSHDVGVPDSVTTDEVFAVKRLNEKGQYQRHFSSSEDEDKEEEYEESTGRHLKDKEMRPSLMKRSTPQNVMTVDLRPTKGARKVERPTDAQGEKTDRYAPSQDYYVLAKGKSDGSKHEVRDGRKYEQRDRDDRKYEQRDERKGERRVENKQRLEEKKIEDKPTRAQASSRSSDRKSPFQEGEHGHGPSRQSQDVRRLHTDVLGDGPGMDEAGPTESHQHKKAPKGKLDRSGASFNSRNAVGIAGADTRQQSAKRDLQEEATLEPPGGDQTRPVVDDIRSRQLKERNKGMKANHNRKDLADRKRNKGMGGPF